MKSLLAASTLVVLTPLSSFAIFYGENDYVEIDQIVGKGSKVDWRTLAKSVAILVPDPGPGDFDVSKRRTLRERYRKPPLDPPYKHGVQPTLGRLTVFLVAPDKVLTAGHATRRLLERGAFLFDFMWDSKNKRLKRDRYKASEIYRCKKILLFRHDNRGDYALCQLDRPVPNRKPLSLQVFSKASEIDKLPATMISAPDGTPLKLTKRGEILGKRPSKHAPRLNLDRYFFHTLDNSYGSSGAPIFDAKTGRVIGIQTGGDDNFTTRDGSRSAVRGNFETSNLGRALKGEWGCLIPQKVIDLLETKKKG